MEQSLLSLDELSAYISVPKSTIYTWTHQKKIPHVKIGRSLKFERREIDYWVENRRVDVAGMEGLS